MVLCPECGYEDRFHGGPVSNDLDQQHCRIDQVELKIRELLRPNEDIVIGLYVYRWSGKIDVRQIPKAVYDSRKGWPSRWRIPKEYYDKYRKMGYYNK